MKTMLFSLLLATVMISTTATISSAGKRSLGGGMHYLRNLGDIDKDESLDLSKDSFGILVSAKNNFGLLSLDGQLEYVFNYAGTDNSMWIPQLYLLAGGFIYGGVGIGIGNIDGDWQSDPFYALRGGVEIPLGGLNLDAYATYQFWSDDDLKNLTGEDLDSLTLAAILRFNL